MYSYSNFSSFMALTLDPNMWQSLKSMREKREKTVLVYESSLCEPGPEKDISQFSPSRPTWTVLPVVLFLAADLEAVVQWESLESVPVCQLHPQGVLPLAGQLVNVLVPQPVLGGQSPEALWARQKAKRINTNRKDQKNTKVGKLCTKNMCWPWCPAVLWSGMEEEGNLPVYGLIWCSFLGNHILEQYIVSSPIQMWVSLRKSYPPSTRKMNYFRIPLLTIGCHSISSRGLSTLYNSDLICRHK